MKITRRQLRRLIRESLSQEVFVEQGQVRAGLKSAAGKVRGAADAVLSRARGEAPELEAEVEEVESKFSPERTEQMLALADELKALVNERPDNRASFSAQYIPGQRQLMVMAAMNNARAANPGVQMRVLHDGGQIGDLWFIVAEWE